MFTICLLTFCSQVEMRWRIGQNKQRMCLSTFLMFPPPYYSLYIENSILLIFHWKLLILHWKLWGIHIVLGSSAIGFQANFGNSIYWEMLAKLGLWKMILIPVFEGGSNSCGETISISLWKSESDRMGLTTLPQLETTGFPIWVNGERVSATLAS